MTGGDAAVTRARLAASGVTVDRAMPGLRAVAVRQDKASGGAILAGLGLRAGAAARAAGGAGTSPHKIWLDAVRRPLLDRSVAQIGGPAVHARGLTGAGVVVAVLDTGIDAAHPDLAGKVLEAREFPAGGEASVALTVDTRRGGPDGAYGGHLVATAGDVRVATAIGVDQEVESYDLGFDAIGRDGGFADSLVILWPVGATGLALEETQFLLVDDAATFRLPRGSYRFTALMFDLVDDTVMSFARPRLDLVADEDIALDGRRTRPVDLTVPGVALSPGRTRAAFTDVTRRFTSSVTAPGLLTAQLGPDAAPGEVDATLVTSAVPSRAGDAAEVYAFGRRERGRYFTGWQQRIARRELATIVADHAGEAGVSYRKTAFAVRDDAAGQRGESTPTDHEGPFRRTEHYFGAGLRWVPVLLRGDAAGVAVARLEAVRRYLPGQRDREAWSQAPFGPALVETAPLASLHVATPARQGNVLTLDASMFSDQSSPSRVGRAATVGERTALLRDGQLLVSSASPLTQFVVPPGPAIYRLERSSARGPHPDDGSPLFELSTEVAAAWTFRSALVAGATPLVLPVPSLRFQPALDDDSRAPGRVMMLPIAIERPAGAATPRIASVTVDASFDDGATWTRVPVVLLGDRALAVVVHPARAAFASLRGSVADADGNRGELTIVRAYRL